VSGKAHKSSRGTAYASAFRRKLYRSLEELQADVDVWLGSYNIDRTHSGKYCYGKTPMQALLDSVHLAREMPLDRTELTTEQQSVAA
jgi:hypothetical protein